MTDSTPDELHEARLDTLRVLAYLRRALRDDLDEADGGLLLTAQMT